MKRDSIFIVISLLLILLSASVSASFPYHVFNDKVFNLFELNMLTELNMPTGLNMRNIIPVKKIFSFSNPYQEIHSNYAVLNQEVIILNLIGVIEEKTEPIIQEQITKATPKDVIQIKQDPVPTNLVLNNSILKKKIIIQNTPAQHHVSFTMKGFEPSMLTISSGDEVIWTNTRSKTQAMLLGSRQYIGIKSEILTPNETFSYTFTTLDNYIFVDAIMFNYVFKLVVE